MNYGDPAQQQQQQQQQQQYYVQRMPQQAQRMAFPPQQQQQMQQPSAGGMMVPQQQQQQAQQQQQSRQTMVYPSPHQQQQMMRMPAQHIYNTQQQQQQGMGTQQQQQQQQFKNFLQSLPPGLQAQINAEKDPERKKQIIQVVHSQRQQHQQQMFEQQQQHMAMMGAQGGTVHNQPGPMAMRPMAAQRMPMVQTTNGTTSIIFATTTNAQPMPQQSQNVHFQRIPSQSSFVTHSSSPTPMGTANNNYQPRVASAASHAPQMFMAGQQQQQMPGGGAQIRAVTTTAPGTVNQSQQFVQQQQQMGQQQFHRQQQQFEQMPAHMAAQQQIKTDNGMVNSYQIGTPTALSAGDSGAVSQNRMTTSTIVVKTESGLSAAMGSTSVRTPAGAIDGPPSADSYPPSVGTANGMATGRPGSVHQQSGSAASQVDTEEPEYKMLLKKLCKYHADVKRLLGRFELDTLPGVEMKIKASLVNVIQVMEGTRKGGPVTKNLLQKLLSNVQTVLERHHISRHLFSIAKKLSTLAPPHNGTSANGGGGTTPTTAPKEEPFETDPWRNVRHMAIKLPDAVLTILEDEKKGTAAEKQHKKADENGSETANSESGGKEWTGRKRIRQQNEQKEDGKGEGPPAKKSLLERVAESFEAAQNPALPSVENEHSLSTSASEQQQKQPNRHFRISCLDGTELVLNRTISEELSKAIGMGFAVHTEGTDIEPPISRNSPAIQIRFEWRGSATKGQNEEEKEKTSFLTTTTTPCSLDVLMPVSFPDAPLELFLHHHQLATAVPSPQMECLMDKIDSGTVDMYSLDALLSEWANCTDSLTDEDTDE
ncbi:hypothetical protein niasHT_007488 [Heterodera trifolii]|uniref:Mediator complex subunit 15 n=1 Tax=Heterodera trifolii TaxID=157864 RepID=A0ABD2LQZ8_9BILA